ncbi:MAG: NPCBM/NEW2 domain-containing protein [Phycisphaerae bacterium]|nr:NPCBM/NEW2 domain-containing protein [Phycisphaerae bacterium]
MPHAVLVVLSVASCIVMATDSDAVPAPTVRIVTIEGEQQTGTWRGADEASIEIQRDGVTTRVPRDDLMLVTFDNESTTSRPVMLGPREAVCTLADDSVIRGELLESGEGAVQIRTALLGLLTLRFSQLRAIRLGAVADQSEAQAEYERWLDRGSAGNDVLIAVRDERVTAVRGALVAIGPDEGRFTFQDKTLPIRAGTVYAVVFGAALATGSPSAATVVLRDGTRLASTTAGADAQTIQLRREGKAFATVPITSIEHIAFHSPRVTFASDMPNVGTHFEPFLRTPWPIRRDRSVSNGPIRLGGVTYDKGFGVHSRSELTFDLDETYTRFAAVIGIDDAVRPRGNVVFRVFADDRTAYDSGPVTGTDAPKPILVDIGGARRVRLVVEYGDELDLADHADWGNARFIR